MGLFDFIKSKLSGGSQPQKAFDIELAEHEVTEKKEKPEPAPRKITNEDMQQFEMLPFTFSEPVKYWRGIINPYRMNLSPDDQFTVIRELAKLDVYIRQSPSLSPLIPADINIMLDSLVFTESKSKDVYTPYTHLICNPYTATGKLSKHPVGVSFSTPQDSFVEWVGNIGRTRTLDCSEGVVWYSRDGEISKAHISIWKNYEGYFYDFKTVGKTFYLNKIVSTVSKGKNDLPGVIYKLDI